MGDPDALAWVPPWSYPPAACTCTSRIICAACTADTAERYRRWTRRPAYSYVSRLAAVHDDLVARYAAGASLKALARRYGLAPTTIRSYLRRRGLYLAQPRGGRRAHARP